MASLLKLLLFALVFPLIWGFVVHRVLTAFWPIDRRGSARWTGRSADRADSDLVDYQI